MPRIGLIVGNGLTIDYCHSHSPSIDLPDPSDPFHWEFRVPDRSGLPWQEAFPLLSRALSDIESSVHSFDAFAFLLARLRSGRHDSVRLDAEARQFLVFAYSEFQSKVDPIGCLGWRWQQWLAKHSNHLAAHVSFNYDRILELAASSCGLDLAPIGVSAANGTRLLVKPHGSIEFECDPRAISMPPSRYPLVNWSTLNNVPIIALDPCALLANRQEAFVVLPAETSPYLNYQWVAPGYRQWMHVANELTHCVMVGLSYWHCDRQEINYLVDSLGPTTLVIIANPEPPEELIAHIEASGRSCAIWRTGPLLIDDVA